MLQHTEQILQIFISLLLPLVGFRIIFDYTRMILFKD